jgi:hypothetical protein
MTPLLSSRVSRRPLDRRLAALAAVLAPLTLVTLPACNEERTRECSQFLSAMSSLGDAAPTADAVDRVRQAVQSMHFQDQPLGIYAQNYTSTLQVLAGTLKLQESTPEPPDGTDEVIKSRLKEARADRDDAQRYCSR